MKTENNSIIIGAGIYGLYAAKRLLSKNKKVIVLEKESKGFERSTYINQARVHLGFHYPRSLSTAKQTAEYFSKFSKDFEKSINDNFDQIYATSKDYSWTNANQFKQFSSNLNTTCEEVPTSLYFKNDVCDGAFLTEETTYDSKILLENLLEELKKNKNFKIIYNVDIELIEKKEDFFGIHFTIDGKSKILTCNFILNATYASVNQILNKTKNIEYEPFKIKYELCEIILVKPSEKLKHIGLTVMDGPFFSIMPFGKTEYHSLTSVSFTPHVTSYDLLPTFDCQKKCKCSPSQLENCNNCPYKPKTAWPYMSGLAKKYIKDDYDFEYVKSLYSIKPILLSSEIDDSRPTVIKVACKNPTFISVLSGKVSTIYDLDDYL